MWAPASSLALQRSWRRRTSRALAANILDVLFGQHFGCALVQLFGASDFREAGQQVVRPQAPFFRALKIVDDLVAMHHDKAISQTGGLMHGMRDHQRGE